MPPRAKFTKEEIVTAALTIVREEGLSALTARNLGKSLGSSACPIFTVFSSMEEVHQAVIGAAKKIYKEYIEKGIPKLPVFSGVGEQYILFAINEPNLFKILFMTENESMPIFSGVLPLLDESYDKILHTIQEGYRITEKEAERLYRHLWVYTHGIATLCVTKMCRFTSDEIGTMTTEVFLSLLEKMKGERLNDRI